MKPFGHLQNFPQARASCRNNKIRVAGTVKGPVEIKLARGPPSSLMAARSGEARYSLGLSNISLGSRPVSKQAMEVMILKVEPGG